MALEFTNATARAAYAIDPLTEVGKTWFQLDTNTLYRAKRGGAGAENWEEVATIDVGDDPSPSLAANLDTAGFSIVTTASNQNIPLTPHGTGTVRPGAMQLQGALDVNSQSIVSNVTNGGIALIPNGTGAITLNSYPFINKALIPLTDAATIATNCAFGSAFAVTLGGNRTLGNPTNAVIGATYYWILTQDGSGSRTITLDTNFRVAGGNCALTATAAAVDILVGYTVSASLIYIVSKQLAVAVDS